MTSLSDLIAAYQPEVEDTPNRTTNSNKSKTTKETSIQKRRRQNTSKNDDSVDAPVNKRPSRKRRQEEESKANNVITENDRQDEEEEGEEITEFDWWDEDDENDNRRAASIKKTDEFYETYAETVQALYPTAVASTERKANDGAKGNPPPPQVGTLLPEQERHHLDSLNVIHNALHPQGLEKKSANKGGVEKTGYSNSLAGRYQPRRRRVRIQPGVGIAGGHNARNPDLMYRMETPEEVEDRVRRRQRVDMNRFIRMRWKRRSVTFQGEDDVGNAFAARAELYLADKLRREKKAQRQEQFKLQQRKEKEQKEKETQEAIEREQLDELEEEDSVREQSQLLAQLSQSQTVPGNVTSDPQVEQQQVDSVDPAEMDYWHYGHVKPRSEDLQFKYKPSMKEVVEQKSTLLTTDGEHEAQEDGTEVKATFRQLTAAESVNEGDRFYFPPNSTLITNSTTTFRPGYKLSSARQFLIMAFRALCGAPSGNVALENRYIRLLCVQARGLNVKREENATLANFRMSRFVNMHTEEQGQSMFLFVQNAWTNPYEAARQLGLLDSHQASPISNSILTSVPASYKVVRTKAKKCFQKSSRLWSYENAVDEEADGGEQPEENESFEREPVTSAGIFDICTRGSNGSAPVGDSVLAKLSKESRGALINANCLYSHVEGTKPPVPQFPLEPTRILFGPVDKYANFYHSSVKMEHGVYKLILSALLTRVAKEISKNDGKVRTCLPIQVSKLVTEFADRNENNLHKRSANQITSNNADIPLVEFYRGVFGYCGFLASGCARMSNALSRQSEGNLKVGDSEDDLYDAFEGTANNRWILNASMNRVAASIWDFCHTRINHNGLLRFPKLRITCAVAMICRVLPAGAAEILSRPLDDDGNRSPIHLFRNMLEYLETGKMLLDSTTSEDAYSKDSVRAAELEYIIHDAGDLIQEAILLDPVNVDYHLWHIGCLSSCLLLSSGNKISSRAHLYPSQKKGSFLFSKGPRHEVRTRLKKYYDVRIEVATAIKSLLALVRRQSSAKAHFAISTILEWRQLMGLLVGSPMEEYVDDIGKIHEFHTQQWLLKDTSSFAKKYLRKVNGSRDLFIHCRNLETDPCDVSAWRCLVQCLGPIGREDSPPDDLDIDIHRKGCLKCSRLCNPRWIDHAKKEREQSLGLWWGEGREWWEESILSVAHSASKKGITERKRLVDSVLQRLRQEDRIDCSSHIDDNVTSRIGVWEMNDHIYGWVPGREDVLLESQDENDVSDDIRSTCYAPHLPKSLEVLVHESEMFPDSEDMNMKSKSDMLPKVSSSRIEINAYKVFVLCHMFGPDHPSIGERIYHEFIYNCYQNTWGTWMKNQCDELAVLKWFHSMGLNLEAVFQDLCTESCIRNAKYNISNDDPTDTWRNSLPVTNGAIPAAKNNQRRSSTGTCLNSRRKRQSQQRTQAAGSQSKRQRTKSTMPQQQSEYQPRRRSQNRNDKVSTPSLLWAEV
jgi:hypothetical protein